MGRRGRKKSCPKGGEKGSKIYSPIISSPWPKTRRRRRRRRRRKKKKKKRVWENEMQEEEEEKMHLICSRVLFT
jgi:hypothetical protein